MDQEKDNIEIIDDNRILNEQGEEISIDDVDKELGYLKPEEIFVKHIDEVEEVPGESHYEVKTFYFTDHTKMDINEPDPHVEWIDNKKGIVKYVDQGEGKTWFGTDLKTITDIEGVPYQPAKDIYEKIQRYVLYTPEELAERAAEEAKKEEQKLFLETGPQRLEMAEMNVEDLTLLMAEMIGV